MPTFRKLVSSGRSLTDVEFHFNELLVSEVARQGCLNIYIRRIKGLGDVLMASLIARAVERRLSPKHYKVHFVTTPTLCKLIKKAKLVKSVKEDRDVSGLCTVNLQDRVDYLPICMEGHRLDLMAKAVGIPMKYVQSDFRVKVSRGWKIWGRNRLAGHKNKKVIALAPWATAPIRSWPNWVELLFFLLQTGEYTVVLLYNTKIDTLEHPNLINLTGKSSVSHLFSILSMCDVAVVVDSGILHICGFIGTPFVGLFGPIHPDSRVKYYDNKEVLFLADSCKICPCWDWQKGACADTDYYMKCMKDITPLMVFRSIKKLLKLEGLKHGTEVERRPVRGGANRSLGQVREVDTGVGPGLSSDSFTHLPTLD